MLKIPSMISDNSSAKHASVKRDSSRRRAILNLEAATYPKSPWYERQIVAREGNNLRPPLNSRNTTTTYAHP